MTLLNKNGTSFELKNDASLIEWTVNTATAPLSAEAVTKGQLWTWMSASLVGGLFLGRLYGDKIPVIKNFGQHSGY